MFHQWHFNRDSYCIALWTIQRCWRPYAKFCKAQWEGLMCLLRICPAISHIRVGWLHNTHVLKGDYMWKIIVWIRALHPLLLKWKDNSLRIRYTAYTWAMYSFSGIFLEIFRKTVNFVSFTFCPLLVCMKVWWEVTDPFYAEIVTIIINVKSRFT